MPIPFRLTQRSPVPMTEAARRRLRRLAAEVGLEESEALSFLLEHLDSVTDTEAFTHRLRLFKAALPQRKR